MISNFLKKISHHYLAIIISIIFSLAIISPRLVSQFIVKDDFKGIYPVFIEDEAHYASRIKEVLNGRLILGNPYIKEHQDDIFIQPPLSEWIIASVAYCTGLSVSFTLILSSIFIVSIFFLLSYIFFYRIYDHKLWSVIFTSFFFFLFYQTFGRPISPQLNFIFLLVGLITIFDIYNNREGIYSIKINNILVGFLSGVCLFISPYYFTTLVVVYGLVILYKLFKDKNILGTIYESLYFIIAFAPFAFIYGFFLLRAGRLAAYLDVSTRFGMIHSHWPGSYSNIILGIISVLLLLISKKLFNENKQWFLGFIFALSIFILNWQNIITGQALQFPSHYLVVTILFVISSMAISIKHSIDSVNRTKKIIVYSLILIVAMILVVRQSREFTVLVPKVPSRDSLINLQKEKYVFDWLNKNTPENSVVNVLGEDLNSMIIIYTKNKVFYNRYGALYLINDLEVYNRWLIQNYFVPEIDKDYVVKNQKDIWWNRYVDSYFFHQNKNKILSKLFGAELAQGSMVPNSSVLEILKLNQDIRSAEINSVLHKYEMDYIVVDKSYEYYAEAAKKISKIKTIHKVADLEIADIYKVD